jgi:hypothetical protein
MVPTVDMGTDTQACGDKDPAHDWPSMVTHYNGGKLDGWLQTQPTGDDFPIGYYGQAQVPVLGALAQNYRVRPVLLLAPGRHLAEPLLPAVLATDMDVTDFFPGEGKPLVEPPAVDLRPVRTPVSPPGTTTGTSR